MRRIVLFLGCMMLSIPAWATCSPVPITFVTGATIQAGDFNTNFSSVVNCINAIDAGQITTGTLATARISGSYTGITAVGTLSSLTTSGNISDGGTLSVTGAATLSSTLGVTGASTLGALTASGVTALSNATITMNGLPATAVGSQTVCADTGGSKFLSFNNAAVHCSALSDGRMKTAFEMMSVSEAKPLLLLQAWHYRWLDAERDRAEGPQIGLVAQDVERWMPALVGEWPGSKTITDAKGVEHTVDRPKYVDYEKVVVPLIVLVKDLEGRVEALEQTARIWRASR